MPDPKENKQPFIDTDKKKEENEFLNFLDDPVQEFDAPELPETEIEEKEQYDPFEIVEDEPKAKTPRTEKDSSGMASRYIKLWDKGFSNIAAVYASGDVTDYQIDQSDQDDLAEPLAELIAENDILDLPPGWALVVTAGIIYAPLIMKAVGQRKDHKALEPKPEKKDTQEPEIIEEKKDVK